MIAIISICLLSAVFGALSVLTWQTFRRAVTTKTREELDDEIAAVTEEILDLIDEREALIELRFRDIH